MLLIDKSPDKFYLFLSPPPPLSQGLGTDEDTLIEILASRTNKEIVKIRSAYKEGVLPRRYTVLDKER